MTITLPLPSKKLSPNARLSWKGRSRLTRHARRVAYLHALAAIASNGRPKFTRYRLRFYFPDRRRRDDDNASASCKAYRDGIADALQIDDHSLRQSAAPEMLHDATNPRLEFILLP